jgi:hypothetical protein
MPALPGSLLLLGSLLGHGDDERAAAPDFLLHVEPVLQRAGCSSAYCHGSATGRGGFKLSLFGSDPQADHGAMAVELQARRVDFAAPEQSLLLRKPSKRMPHGGGRVLPADGDAYRILRDWIAGGAPGPAPEAAAPEPLTLLREGDHVRVLRGKTDVSALAVLSSSDERVAEVSADGALALHGPGEAWLFARYAGQSARLPVVQPFAASPMASGPVPSTSHELDRVWLARLGELGLQPAPLAPPTTLVRRLYVDLAGRPPSPEEVRRFLRSDPATRVAATVDALLPTRGFRERFAGHLARWLEVPSGEQARDARLHDLCAQAVSKDRLESLWEQVQTAGPRHQLVVRFGDPRDRAEFVGRAFLGTRIGCARCHDHPLDRWKQTDHLAFSAQFADPRPVPGSGMTTTGIFFHPETGKAVAPQALPLGREQFARALANRVFAALTGRGLVEPLDDHRLTNPAVHEPVLEHLTARALADGGSLRNLVRHIATSRLYACDSAAPEAGARGDAERRAFAVREARPAGSALLGTMLAAVLGMPPQGPGVPSSPLPRQLHLLNGPALHQSLDRGGTQIDALVDLGGEAGEQLNELWLLVLSRPPRAEEQSTFLPELQQTPDRRAALRDLACALLLGREFGSLR